MYVLITRRWVPGLVPRTVVQLLTVLAALLVPKLVQEWILHWEQAHPWFWFRQTFIEPLLGCSTPGSLGLRGSAALYCQ